MAFMIDALGRTRVGMLRLRARRRRSVCVVAERGSPTMRSAMSEVKEAVRSGEGRGAPVVEKVDSTRSRSARMTGRL